MFNAEETLVRNKFLETFSKEAKLFNDLLQLYEKLIYKVSTPPEEHNKYCAALLAGLNLKSFSSAFDRLSKGYLSDSEVIFKKILESFLAEVYFYEHLDKAKEWTQGKKIDSLEANRKEIARILDKINKEKNIFPTDFPNFFEEYIYGVGYANSNKVAHLDFEFVHQELGLENDPKLFATTLVVGPKYDKEFMKVILNRLTMFCMFQITYLKETFNISFDPYKDLFNQVTNLLMELPSEAK